MSNSKQAEWSARLSSALGEAQAAARSTKPTPSAVGRPEGLADDGVEPEEILEEGPYGFAWVELSSESTEADEFIAWLSGHTATEHPAPVGVSVLPDDEGQERRPVRIDTSYDSYDRSKAAAEVLAGKLDGIVQGLRARAEARYN